MRHATQYSPLLAMLSAPKPENVIHSSMLLRSITPEIHARNQQLLEKVKSLSQIRTQLEEKQNKLRDITFQYHQDHDKDTRQQVEKELAARAKTPYQVERLRKLSRNFHFKKQHPKITPSDSSKSTHHPEPPPQQQQEAQVWRPELTAQAKPPTR